MHAIQERPVAREGQVVVRPMMYVALTYDHRIVDGREAVTFLKRIKECVEQPSRILLEVRAMPKSNTTSQWWAVDRAATSPPSARRSSGWIRLASTRKGVGRHVCAHRLHPEQGAARGERALLRGQAPSRELRRSHQRRGTGSPKMLAKKDAVVKANTQGVDFLFKKNKVTRYHGTGRFAGQASSWSTSKAKPWSSRRSTS